ncbi:MAG: preprotein translocase subunit SecG [Hyphomonadaceae bacterium]|nr:preprotein translocase subunit SecG [Hyphomonadaceae bacterium]
MVTVVLIIHLLVSICLIGLVLLQRSEGGALGMGGGGGGSLMSGRGAADALAKMTSVAGGFFLVTSLGLTVLSGAASGSGRSVFDLLPQNGAPAVTAPPSLTPEEPAPSTAPDPTESSAPQAAETQLASVSPSTTAQPAAAGAAPPRAAPLTQPAATPVRQPAAPVSTPARSATPTTVPASTQTRAPVIPTTPGSSVSGINLEGDDPSAAESIEIAPVGVQPVRRERAGPDQ